MTTALHRLACSRCRAGLGRPLGLLSHARVLTADDIAADERAAIAVEQVRWEDRQRRQVRKALPLLWAHGHVIKGDEA